MPASHRQLFAAAGVALLATMSAAPAIAASKTATTTQILDAGLDQQKHLQYVMGAVCTPKCFKSKAVNGESVTVKYLHKTSSGWVLIAKKKAKMPAFHQNGEFYTELGPAPKKGTCKLITIYPGDATYAASKATGKVDCATGYPNLQAG